jgi:hypothetical protein
MLFLMGDHRENSTDSRAQAIGPVKTSDVIGRAWLRYWPIPALKVLDHPSYAGVPSAPTAGGPVPGAVDRVAGLGAPAAPAP